MGTLQRNCKVLLVLKSERGIFFLVGHLPFSSAHPTAPACQKPVHRTEERRTSSDAKCRELQTGRFPQLCSAPEQTRQLGFPPHQNLFSCCCLCRACGSAGTWAPSPAALPGHWWGRGHLSTPDGNRESKTPLCSVPRFQHAHHFFLLLKIRRQCIFIHFHEKSERSVATRRRAGKWHVHKPVFAHVHLPVAVCCLLSCI